MFRFTTPTFGLFFCQAGVFSTSYAAEKASCDYSYCFSSHDSCCHFSEDETITSAGLCWSFSEHFLQTKKYQRHVRPDNLKDLLALQRLDTQRLATTDLTDLAELEHQYARTEDRIIERTRVFEAAQLSQDLLAAFHRELSVRNLKVATNPGDGNCMIHALLRALPVHLNWTPLMLRRVVYNHLLSRADFFYEGSSFPSVEAFRVYIKSQRDTDGQYCDEIFLQGFCDLFNRRVLVYQVGPSLDRPLTQYFVGGAAEQADRSIIALFFVGGNHFNSVVPRDEAVSVDPALDQAHRSARSHSFTPLPFHHIPVKLRRDPTKNAQTDFLTLEKLKELRIETPLRFHPAGPECISPLLAFRHLDRAGRMHDQDPRLVYYYHHLPVASVFSGHNIPNITCDPRQNGVHYLRWTPLPTNYLSGVYLGYFDDQVPTPSSLQDMLAECGRIKGDRPKYDGGYHAWGTYSACFDSTTGTLPRNLGPSINTSHNPDDVNTRFEFGYHLGQPWIACFTTKPIPACHFLQEAISVYNVGPGDPTAGHVPIRPATTPTAGLIRKRHGSTSFLYVAADGRALAHVTESDRVTLYPAVPIFDHLRDFHQVALSAFIPWHMLQSNAAHSTVYYVSRPERFDDRDLSHFRSVSPSQDVLSTAHRLLLTLVPNSRPDTHCYLFMAIVLILSSTSVPPPTEDALTRLLSHFGQHPSSTASDIISRFSVLATLCPLLNALRLRFRTAAHGVCLIDVSSQAPGNFVLCLDLNEQDGSISILDHIPTAIDNSDPPTGVYHAKGPRNAAAGGNAAGVPFTRQQALLQQQDPGVAVSGAAPAASTAPATPARPATPGQRPSSVKRRRSSGGTPRVPVGARAPPSAVVQTGHIQVISMHSEFEDEDALNPESQDQLTLLPPRRWEQRQAPTRNAEHTFRYPIPGLYSNVGYAHVLNGPLFNDRKSGRGVLETADRLLIGCAPTYKTPAEFRLMVAALRNVQHLLPPLDFDDLERRIQSDKSIFVQCLTTPNCGYFWVCFADGASVSTSLAAPVIRAEYHPSLVYPKYFELVFNGSLGGSVQQGREGYGPAHPWTVTFQPLSATALKAIIEQPPLLFAAIPAHRTHISDALVTLQLMVNRFPFFSSPREMAANPHPISVAVLMRNCSAKKGQRYTQVILRVVCARTEKYLDEYVSRLRDSLLTHLHLAEPASVQLVLADSHLMALAAESSTAESYVRDHYKVFPQAQVQHLKVHGSDCTYSANLRAALQRTCGLTFGEAHQEETHRNVPVIHAIVSGGLAVDKADRPQFYKEHSFWLRLSVPPCLDLQLYIAHMAGSRVSPEWTGLPFEQILEALRAHDHPMPSYSQPDASQHLIPFPARQVLSIEDLARLQSGELTLQQILSIVDGTPLIASATSAAAEPENLATEDDVTRLIADHQEQMDRLLQVRDAMASAARARSAASNSSILPSAAGAAAQPTVIQK